MSFGQKTTARSKPEVDFPEEGKPEQLRVTDIIEGTGKKVEAGDQVSVHYVGVTFDGGEEFDASWNRNRPLDFTAGIGQVIEGWDSGLIGMKVGGRRRLEIPSTLAYGSQGAGDIIGPDEDLIFVVDLLDVTK